MLNANCISSSWNVELKTSEAHVYNMEEKTDAIDDGAQVWDEITYYRYRFSFLKNKKRLREILNTAVSQRSWPNLYTVV